MYTFSTELTGSLFVCENNSLDYSWDEDSESDYLQWKSTASNAQLKLCAKLMIVYLEGIIKGKGNGFPDNDIHSVYSANGYEIDLYKATRDGSLCMYAGIHKNTNQCRLVLIGKCDTAHQLALATARIKNWKV